MNTQSQDSTLWRWSSVLGFALLLFAVGAVVWRADSKRSAPGEIVDSRFDDNQGYRDFHNAIYFPVRGFVSGVNPYSAEYANYHPDGLGFPLFAPSSLLVHSPLAFMNLQTAETVYLIINIGLLIFICWFCVRKSTYPFSMGVVLGLAAVVVICRPGLLNFLGLQMTLLLILGTLLALEYSQSSPALSGFGILLACCKPTYAIPLIVLMIARRNLSAAALGIFFCAIANCAAVGLIASHQSEQANAVSRVEMFYLQAVENYGASDEPKEIPKVQTSWSRLDLYSVIARWYDVSKIEKLNFVVPACVLFIGVFFILLERDPEQRVGVNSRTGLLTLLVVLSCLYHQPYDALLLWLPLSALLLGSSKFEDGISYFSKSLLIFLMLLPLFNFLSTKIVLDRLNLPTPFTIESVSNGRGPSPAPAEASSGVELEAIWSQLSHCWPWKLAVTINGIAIFVAVIVVAMTIVRGRKNV